MPTFRRQESRPASEFEHQYQQQGDPWGYETSPYEQGKYAATLAALPRPRYQTGLEIGCSIGVLTLLLAERCDQLLAIDFAATALARARVRLADQPHVEFRQLTLPDEFPSGKFDLIVLSEVGYYWSALALKQASDRIVAGLVPDGHLLLVHWLLPIDDAPLVGDDVHQEFTHRQRHVLDHLMGQRTESYRLDLFVRRA